MSPVPTPIMPGAGHEELMYRGQALAQLRILKQQLALGNLKVGTRKVLLAEGVVCVCSICHNYERVDVYLKKTASDRYLYILLYQSNMAPYRETDTHGYNNKTSQWFYPYNHTLSRVNSINTDLDERSDLIREDSGYQNWQNTAGDYVCWKWGGCRYAPDLAVANFLFSSRHGAVTAPGKVVGAGMRTVGAERVLLVAVENGGLFYYIPASTSWVRIEGITFETNPVFFTYSGHKCAYVYVHDERKRYNRTLPDIVVEEKSELVIIEISGSSVGNLTCSVTRKEESVKTTYFGTYSGPIGPYTARKYENLTQKPLVNFFTGKYQYTWEEQVGYFDTPPLPWTGTAVQGCYTTVYVDATDDIIVAQLVRGTVTKNAAIFIAYGEFGTRYAMGPYANAESTSLTGSFLRVASPTTPTTGLIDIAVTELMSQSTSGGIKTKRFNRPVLFDLRTNTKFFYSYISECSGLDTSTLTWKRGMYFLPDHENKAAVWEQQTVYASNLTNVGDGILDRYNHGLASDPLTYPHLRIDATSMQAALHRTARKTRIFATVTCSDALARSIYIDDEGTDRNPGDTLDIATTYFFTAGIARAVKPT